MRTADALLSLIPLIYDAAIDPDQWPLFLEGLNSTLGGACSVLQIQNTGARQSGRVLAGVGVDFASRQQYEEYYASRNIWTIRGRKQLREGAILTGEMVCPNQELERSEYYNDYLKALGFYYAIASVPSATSRRTMLVSSFRSRKSGTFPVQCVALQRQLLPHLKRAAAVHDRLLSANAERRALRDALEAMPFGVILLDGTGRTLFANRMARRIARDRDGLELSSDGPATSLTTETTRLRQCIASALDAGLPDSEGGGSLSLSRPSGRRDLEVLVTAVGRNADQFGHSTTAVAIFVADPELEPQSAIGLLQEFHHLTPSEARLAAGLIRGRSIEELATEARITRNTARWVVKQILHKTGTRSQAQAVALLLRGLSLVSTRR